MPAGNAATVAVASDELGGAESREQADRNRTPATRSLVTPLVVRAVRAIASDRWSYTVESANFAAAWTRACGNSIVGVTLPFRGAYTNMKIRNLLFPVAILFAGAASADAPKAKDTSRIEISVTKRGFDPDAINVPAKKPVTLVFTRTTDQTCTKSVVLTLEDGKKVERDLPLDKPVELAVTFPKAGKLGYACSMDMAKGIIVVQ
jgi:plastocyanin